MRSLGVIAGILILQAFPVATLFAQPAARPLLAGVWWKDCELDTRYDQAWGTGLAFGIASAGGAWKVREITKLAEAGDACMQFLAGEYFDPDRDVITDLAPPAGALLPQALKWFQLAGEQGHGSAQEVLGEMYYQGTGVRKNNAEAARWFRKAADQGLSCSQLQLGSMYRDADGVPKDYASAHMWLTLASTHVLEVGIFCNEMARASQRALSALMTPAQLDEAQRRVKEWTRQLSVDPVARRTYHSSAR